MTYSSISEELKKRAEKFEERALSLLDHTSWKDAPSPLKEAIHYSLFAGKSKRLRPILTEEAAKLVGLAEEKGLYLSLAIESIHTYSLVHDDLPALDDDSLRRGKPSCHICFGEDQAILCGDALQALGFELLSLAEVPAKALWVFARDIGASGMVGGQSLDLQSKNFKDLKKLKEIHLNKTGKLFALSFSLPFYFSEKNPNLAYRYGLYLGKLFQMVDDLLDALATIEQVGKSTKKDGAKLTYLSLYGLEKAKKLAYRQALRMNLFASKEFSQSRLIQEIPLWLIRQIPQ